MLFNLYVENVFAEALENPTFGINVNGHPMKNINFADDMALIINNEQEMQILLDNINNAGK